MAETTATTKPHNPRRGRPHALTPDEARQLFIKHYQKGLPASVLAQSYKVSIKTIRRYLNQEKGSLEPIKPKTRILKGSYPVKEYGWDKAHGCYRVYTNKSTWKDRSYKGRALQELKHPDDILDEAYEIYHCDWVLISAQQRRIQREGLRPYKDIWQWIRRRKPHHGLETPTTALDTLLEASLQGGWPIIKQIYPEWEFEAGKHRPGTVAQKKKRANEAMELWYQQDQDQGRKRLNVVVLGDFRYSWESTYFSDEEVVVGRRPLSKTARAAADQWKLVREDVLASHPKWRNFVPGQAGDAFYEDSGETDWGDSDLEDKDCSS